jgi:hypothetical protein
MIKTIIWILVAALLGYLLIVVVPGMIREKKEAEIERASALQEQARQKAEGIAAPASEPGGGGGFRTSHTDKTRENAGRAYNRSDRELEQMERDEQPPPEQEQ